MATVGRMEPPTPEQVQDEPFSIAFTEEDPTHLSLGYTSPGTPQDSGPLWNNTADFDTTKVHHIALARNIFPGGNSKLQMWHGGEQVLDQAGLKLWRTGDVYTKFGTHYRNIGDHDEPDEGSLLICGSIGCSSVIRSWMRWLLLAA